MFIQFILNKKRRMVAPVKIQYLNICNDILFFQSINQINI